MTINKCKKRQIVLATQWIYWKRKWIVKTKKREREREIKLMVNGSTSEEKNIERDRERERKTATFLSEVTIAVRLLSDY